ncbi:MAG: type II toxin-antitoxin system VapC family toxin [Acidithiobacillus sp.]
MHERTRYVVANSMGAAVNSALKTPMHLPPMEDGDVVCTWVIVQEILQGAADPQKLEILRAHFISLPQLAPSLETHVNASTLYARCRWRGITIRSPHDCLIAQTAIEHGVPLLQDDVDFERIALVEPQLSFVSRE